MVNIEQLIAQLDFPAQVWDPEGNVTSSNGPINALFDLPHNYDWGASSSKISVRHGTRFVTLYNEYLSLNATGAAIVGPCKVPLAAITPIETGQVSFGKEQLDLMFKVIPLSGDSGANEGYIVIAERHEFPRDQYETELLRIQSGENLRILASGVAHEFNNIFTGIKGMSDLIKDEVDQSSEIFEFAQSIQSNIDRGAILIQQLSGFAKHLPHSLKRTRLSSYFEHMVPLLEVQVRRRINLELDLRIDGFVMIDHGRMDQALSNVIHNARDAMGGEGQINIVVDRADLDFNSGSEDQSEHNWAMIEIADSGPGIPPEIVARVMEPFYTTKERGKATGLGLSVTYRIVMSHKGLMQIGKSEELGGASLKIFLPIEIDFTDDQV